MGWGITILRLLVGGLFVGHGAQKLFGAFGGPGFEGTAQGFEQMGMAPGRRNAALAGGSELAGGALMASGAATPLAGAALSGTMFGAIYRVHAPKGVWNTEGGYEYNLVMLGSVFAIVADGPGRPRLSGSRSGLGWAVAQLVAGAAGAAIALEIADREAEQQAADARVAQPDGGEPALDPQVAGATA
jgi:putative oxidoreductase